MPPAASAAGAPAAVGTSAVAPDSPAADLFRVQEVVQRWRAEVGAEFADVVSLPLATVFYRATRDVVRRRGAEHAKPDVTYHWTRESNFESILHQGFIVPDKETVDRQARLYGCGIYLAKQFKCEANAFGYYGQGSKHCLLVLAQTGRQYDAKRVTVKGENFLEGLQDGYDSHVCQPEIEGNSRLVLFRRQDALPFALVTEADSRPQEARARKLAEMLHTAAAADSSQAPSELGHYGYGDYSGKGDVRAGAVVRVKDESSPHHGKLATVHSCAKVVREVAQVFLHPRNPKEQLVSFFVEHLELVKAAPPLKRFRISTSLRLSMLEVEGHGSITFGVMGPPDLLEKRAPLPVLIALPGGAGMHVSDFYKSWCVEDRGWVCVVPLLGIRPTWRKASPELIGSLLQTISRVANPEGGKFHLAGRCNGASVALHFCVTAPEHFKSCTILAGSFCDGDEVHAAKMNGIGVSLYTPKFLPCVCGLVAV
eukprot:TRINITY_DN15474_c0_g1_i1.p1 TRINITY_DN15474_c0_g1~~TRINITY_DN15474_c0_g1_i1.p1  ORF type:complete len:514 (+),score=155.87 TRINITY_DN15474_c0_g1_i1:99-1544(+)